MGKERLANKRSMRPYPIKTMGYHLSRLGRSWKSAVAAMPASMTRQASAPSALTVYGPRLDSIPGDRLDI